MNKPSGHNINTSSNAFRAIPASDVNVGVTLAWSFEGWLRTPGGQKATRATCPWTIGSDRALVTEALDTVWWRLLGGKHLHRHQLQ